MTRAVQLTPDQQATLNDAMTRRLDRERRKHARAVTALQAQLTEAHVEIAALRLALEQERSKHGGGSWLRLLPHWFHRPDSETPHPKG